MRSFHLVNSNNQTAVQLIGNWSQNNNMFDAVLNQIRWQLKSILFGQAEIILTPRWGIFLRTRNPKEATKSPQKTKKKNINRESWTKPQERPTIHNNLQHGREFVKNPSRERTLQQQKVDQRSQRNPKRSLEETQLNHLQMSHRLMIQLWRIQRRWYQIESIQEENSSFNGNLS